MKQNLGAVDRVLRFALALWWLGPWQLRSGVVIVDGIIIAVAWIALAESFFGWCWLHEKLHLTAKH